MLFDSVQYFLFLILFLLIYQFISPKFRPLSILFASFYFYMSWKPFYVLLIIISILIDYFSALAIYSAVSRLRKRFFLMVSILANLTVLFVFKYFGFFLDLVGLDNIIHWEILLPIGISFYTLQTMSYTIDVYAGRVNAEKSLINFALYVSFFPQLIAGPIERADHLLSQLKKPQIVLRDDVQFAFFKILVGLVKKVVFSAHLSFMVEEIYTKTSSYSSISIFLSSMFFLVQVYCDFSGYSDIAVGSARLLGVKLTENFRGPFWAYGPKEFWRRWHYSLSSWFRDYVFIPLGGSRVQLKRYCFNLVFVFSLSGLWHGAKFNFIVWGAINGIYILIHESLYSRLSHEVKNNKIVRLISGVLTFVFISLSCIFFRAQDLSQALRVLELLFEYDRLHTGQFNLLDLYLAVGFVVFSFIMQYFESDSESQSLVEGFSFGHKVGLTFGAMVLVAICSGLSHEPFIYFQF